MDSEIYKKKMREYQEKRDRKISIANQKKEKIYNDNPSLKKLEEEKNMIAIKVAKNILVMNEMNKQI